MSQNICGTLIFFGGMGMRFIHTADWHLGRLFHGQHLTEDQAHLLEQFHAVIRDYRPEAVVVAGDIYDRAVPPVEAVSLLDETLSRFLLEDQVKVILIAGNHDSGERLSFGGRLLEEKGIFIRGTVQKDFRPVLMEDSYGPVYFAPFPYAEPALLRAIYEEELYDFDAAMRYFVAQSWNKIPTASRSVAIAHGFVAGGKSSESERPLSVGGSANISSQCFQQFSYTALGHLHNPQTAGGENIRYAGSLLKYSFDEAEQEKGIYIIDIDAAGKASVEKISLSPRKDVRKIKGCFDEILHNRQKYPASDDYMAIELMNTEAILDIRGQLEKIYPWLMQIERPGLLQGGTLAQNRVPYRSQSECDLFTDFYQQMTDEEMNDEQKQYLQQQIDALFAIEREVKA